VAGFGLMDIGAASFCLSAVLVSPKARGRNITNYSTSTWNFRKLLLHTMPLVLLGTIRILTNRELEYQEHVSEYGVHWNFFFTMGILALVPPLVPTKAAASWKLPAIVMALYQIALSMGGLQDFIETAPRHCPWSEDASSSSSSSSPSFATTMCYIVLANREGILGCLGYLSLYFFGEWIGGEYLWRKASDEDATTDGAATTQKQQQQQQYGLFRVSIGLWILLGFLHERPTAR
jgi:phosphatidylinositol glycan class W